jgi:hypothetical protein
MKNNNNVSQLLKNQHNVDLEKLIFDATVTTNPQTQDTPQDLVNTTWTLARGNKPLFLEVMNEIKEAFTTENQGICSADEKPLIEFAGKVETDQITLPTARVACPAVHSKEEAAQGPLTSFLSSLHSNTLNSPKQGN